MDNPIREEEIKTYDEIHKQLRDESKRGVTDRLVRKWGTVEVRLNGYGTIDEIIADDVKNFHLEQMEDGLWWMGIMTRGGQRLMVNLHTRRNAAIACNAESEDGKISEGFGAFSNAAASKPMEQKTDSKPQNVDSQRSAVSSTEWLGLSYQEQCQRAKMAEAGEVWRNNKTGKFVTIRANTWRGIELLHSSGRVTIKQYHYFAGDYSPNMGTEPPFPAQPR